MTVLCSLPIGPFLAPCYKLGLVSTVVHGRFKGSDSGYRWRCRFRGIVDAVAVNPVKYRLAYKVVDVASTRGGHNTIIGNMRS
jgi:hypothetical protein